MAARQYESRTCETRVRLSREELEMARRERASELNRNPVSRSKLEARHGQVWTPEDLLRDFEVIGFAAPFVVVRQRSDGAVGSLEFQHHPRFYFNFELDQPL
ncbi:MAG TPA: hypothetical protein VN577_01520 [Terriglobales bacterium]|nr:hypothetical protein [Terriglobales bacterium]